MNRTIGALLAAASALGIAVSLKRRREEPERLVRRYYAAWQSCDPQRVRELLAEDYRGHVHTLAGTEERDAKQLEEVLAAHCEAFEWTEFEVEDVLRDGDRVAARVAMRAGHRETLREAEMEGLVILRLARGRIAEEWGSWDYLGLAAQLGLAAVG
jgi:ketosteroid isomerase-like protein